MCHNIFLTEAAIRREARSTKLKATCTPSMWNWGVIGRAFSSRTARDSGLPL